MSHIREDVLFKDSPQTEGKGILSARESRRRRLHRLEKLGIEQEVFFSMYDEAGQTVGYQQLVFRRSGALLVFEHVADLGLDMQPTSFPAEPPIQDEQPKAVEKAMAPEVDHGQASQDDGGIPSGTEAFDTPTSDPTLSETAEVASADQDTPAEASQPADPEERVASDAPAGS